MSTALARKGAQPVGLQDWQLMREQSAVLLASGFLPAHIKTPEAAITIMLKGRELDIPALYALSNISVINGKPTCNAELMMALVKRDLGRDAIRVIETTADHCTVEYQDGSHAGTFTFSADDARKAGLWGKAGPWVQYPGAMLRARCISAACRFVFPDVLGGMYTPEELGAEVAVDANGEMDVIPPPAPEPKSSPAGDRAAPALVDGSVGESAPRASMSAPAGGDVLPSNLLAEPIPEGEAAPITAWFALTREHLGLTRAQTRSHFANNNPLDTDEQAVRAALAAADLTTTQGGLSKLFGFVADAVKVREPVTA